MSEHAAGEQGAENDAPTRCRWGSAGLPSCRAGTRGREWWCAFCVTRDAHQHIRLAGGYVACTCGEEWDDYRVHFAEKLAEAHVTPPAAPATPDADDASVGRGDERHPGPIHYVGPNNKTLPVTGPLAAAIARVASAAATKARAEERERIAQAIEAKRAHDDDTLSNCPDGCGWLNFAARIARLAPDTAGGDR